jgi:hypothetical protein
VVAVRGAGGRRTVAQHPPPPARAGLRGDDVDRSELRSWRDAHLLRRTVCSAHSHGVGFSGVHREAGQAREVVPCGVAPGRRRAAREREGHPRYPGAVRARVERAVPRPSPDGTLVVSLLRRSRRRARKR